jgi:hypothetical protein
MKDVPNYDVLTHLNEVTQVLAARCEVEMAEEGQPILPGTPDLQVVGATHIPEVRSIAGCNNRQTLSSLQKLETQNYTVTPCSEVVLENIRVAQLVKK